MYYFSFMMNLIQVIKNVCFFFSFLLSTFVVIDESQLGKQYLGQTRHLKETWTKFKQDFFGQLDNTNANCGEVSLSIDL